MLCRVQSISQTFLPYLLSFYGPWDKITSFKPVISLGVHQIQVNPTGESGFCCQISLFRHLLSFLFQTHTFPNRLCDSYSGVPAVHTARFWLAGYLYAMSIWHVTTQSRADIWLLWTHGMLDCLLFLENVLNMRLYFVYEYLIFATISMV